MPKRFRLFHRKSLLSVGARLHVLLQERLWLKILFAMGIGIIVGLAMSPSTGLLSEGAAENMVSWLSLPGVIFLALIQMVIVPLVFASIILGLAAGEGIELVRKLGLRLVAYFLITTTLAVSIGIGIGFLLQPGSLVDSSLLSELTSEVPESQSAPSARLTAGHLPTMITHMLPDNPLGAMLNKEMLQVVLFAIIFGLALITIPFEISKPLLYTLTALQEVSLTIVRWTMKLAPIAVFGLIAQITLQVGFEAIIGVAAYVGTVLVGLWLLLCLYLVVVKLTTNLSPWAFLQNITSVQLLGFSTSSSAAVMPLTIKTAEKLGVSAAVSQFLVPLGATINMDGTALYQAVATVFLAQVYGIELSLFALILVLITTVGASIGSPATPGVGIVILSMVLSSVGVPPSGIALIIGVDRILDMCRTSINVTGDLTACLVMERFHQR